MEDVAISISIKPTWSIVKEIKEKANRFMEEKGAHKDIKEATIMCATELIENAVKYGTEKPGGGNIEFDLSIDNDNIIIKISNGIKAKHDIDSVIEHIDKLKESTDPAKLYTERLMELMENPKPGVSQLGLYRIAYEGDFSLDYKYDNKILTVIAERKFIN